MRYWLDQVIFAVVNLWVYVAHPRFTRVYKNHFNRFPNVAKPSSLSELMQWRKLFGRDPLFPIFVDKLLAKKWVQEKCPTLKVPWTLWEGVSPREIPDQYLSSECAIKANHGSDHNYFPHRTPLAREHVEKLFETWLSQNLAEIRSEWAYGRVERKIFVETFVRSDEPLIDLSFRAHNGRISMAQVKIYCKLPEQRYAYYFPDGSRYHDDSNEGIPKEQELSPEFGIPANFFEGLEYAKNLSEGLDYIRVDLLSTGNELYFSELTVYPASGYGIDNSLARIVYGAWLRQIHQSWFFKTKQGFLLSAYQSALSRHFSAEADYRNWRAVDQRA